MTSPASFSRRRFLGRAGALGSCAGASWLAQFAALGASASARAGGTGGYKALVCLYLYGGNDAYNTVLATDTDSWSAYRAARAQDERSIALEPVGTPPNPHARNVNARLGGVLAIQPARPQGRTFALHPALDSAASLFGRRRLAVVSNVGPLMRPTTKEQYLRNRVPLPARLFSHNDQQSAWQSMGPEGTLAGWGGGLADLLQDANASPMFTSISLNGAAVWLAGKQVSPYQLGIDGPIHIGSDDGTLFGSALVQQTLQGLMRTSRSTRVTHLEHTAVAGRSIDAQAVLAGALPPAGTPPWGTPHVPPGRIDPLLMYVAPSTRQKLPNPISQQLQAVARMIAARQALGMGRQIFFVGVDGFDTHDNQSDRHADVMAQLAQAFDYWDTVTTAMGVDGAVTTFTASDFGRAFASNGDGTDHGWGGHHLVMGGAVAGGDVYGRFPAYGSADGQGGFTSEDQLRDGALLPVASVDQYAATLGKWFGISDADLLHVLPDLHHFPAGQRNLGFMAGA